MNDPEFFDAKANRFNEAIYEYAEEDGYDRPMDEYGWFVKKNGFVGSSFHGDQHEIGMDEEDVKRFMDNGSWFFHNHPGDTYGGMYEQGGPPSLNDYITSLKIGVDGFIAAVDNGYYKVTFTEKVRDTPPMISKPIAHIIYNIYERIQKDTFGRIGPLVEFEGLHPIEALAMDHAQSWEAMSNDPGMAKIAKLEFVPWR